MTWFSIRLLVACAFGLASLLLLLYAQYLEAKTRFLENKMKAAAKQNVTEHMVGMILCKLLVDSGMSEKEIENRVNAELSKISKERR